MLYDHKRIVASGVFIFGLALLVYFFHSLTPPNGDFEGTPQIFFIEKGASVNEIAGKLHEARLIRSVLGFKVMAVLRGVTSKLQPGAYEITPVWTVNDILTLLSGEGRREAQVTVIEGSSIYDIDQILSEARVISPRSLIAYGRSRGLEGRLFPDTYRLFTSSPMEEVVGIFLKNFESKALPILNADKDNLEKNLILASVLEGEVPDYEERRIVAGILKKRLAYDMPLQVDATICYIKEERGEDKCSPITAIDLKTDSPYNTYLYKGLPPGPIGNPGVQALKAALSPQKSEYWFYLSDPKNRKTIFAITLDEHSKNKLKYLER